LLKESSVEIRQRASGDVTILDLQGEIVGRSGEPERMKSLIDQLATAGQTRVVVNLSGTRLISSIGLGMLVSAYRTFTEKGGMMAVAEPSDPIKPVFRVLRGPFRDFDSEAEAVAFVRAPHD
jgi:anti-anti-sigma factor